MFSFPRPALLLLSRQVWLGEIRGAFCSQDPWCRFCIISLASSHPVFPFSFFYFKVYIIVMACFVFFIVSNSRRSSSIAERVSPGFDQSSLEAGADGALRAPTLKNFFFGRTFFCLSPYLSVRELHFSSYLTRPFTESLTIAMRLASHKSTC